MGDQSTKAVAIFAWGAVIALRAGWQLRGGIAYGRAGFKFTRKLNRASFWFIVDSTFALALFILALPDSVLVTTR